MSSNTALAADNGAAVPITQGDNTRGIPAAHFIEDVPTYLQQHTIDPDALLKQIQSLYGKYKFMESQLVSQQRALLEKIPEIRNALSSINYIVTNKEKAIAVKFELADSIYASASIPPVSDSAISSGTVLLWLGANVMLEYSYDEALSLLNTNFTNAQLSLKSLEKDLAFLKDQITVSEVNIARVHNINVALKQKIKDQAAGGAGASAVTSTTTTIA